MIALSFIAFLLPYLSFALSPLGYMQCPMASWEQTDPLLYTDDIPDDGESNQNGHCGSMDDETSLELSASMERIEYFSITPFNDQITPVEDEFSDSSSSDSRHSSSTSSSSDHGEKRDKYRGDGHNLNAPDGSVQEGDLFRDKNQISSDLNNPGPSQDPELIQSIIFARHGVSTSNSFFYDGEYSGYKMRERDSLHEKLTPLGKAQCWSIGRHLALTYPDLISSAIDENSFLIHAIQLRKSILCANYIYFGLINFVPNIGHFTEDYVKEAFKRKANCHTCTSDSQFPYEESQNQSADINNEDYQTENIEIHPSEFIDLDDECHAKSEFLCTEVYDFSSSDIAVFQENFGYFAGGARTALHMISRHLYHNIPLENGLEDLSQGTILRAIEYKESNSKCVIQSIINVEENEWRMPALFARSLIRETIEKLEGGEKLNIYVLHNNNMVGLRAFLIGAKEKLSAFMNYYGSMTELLVYYEPWSEITYVQLRIDGQVHSMRDCGEQCELSQFLEMLEVYERLGGDLNKWCGMKSQAIRRN